MEGDKKLYKRWREAWRGQKALQGVEGGWKGTKNFTRGGGKRGGDKKLYKEWRVDGRGQKTLQEVEGSVEGTKSFTRSGGWMEGDKKLYKRWREAEQEDLAIVF